MLWLEHMWSPITHTAAITSESWFVGRLLQSTKDPVTRTAALGMGVGSTIKVLEGQVSSEGWKDLLQVGDWIWVGFRHHQPCVDLQNYHPVPDFIFIWHPSSKL